MQKENYKILIGHTEKIIAVSVNKKVYLMCHPELCEGSYSAILPTNNT